MCSLYQCWPEMKDVDLGSIKVTKLLFIKGTCNISTSCSYIPNDNHICLQTGKYWNWYMEFLFNQGFDGLNNFIQTNTGHSSSSLSSQDDRQPASQPWCLQYVQTSGDLISVSVNVYIFHNPSQRLCYHCNCKYFVNVHYFSWKPFSSLCFV